MSMSMSMKMKKYIDYNEVLAQLQMAEIEREWDLITSLIQNLQHFIALEEQQEMIQQYNDDLLEIDNMGD